MFKKTTIYLVGGIPTPLENDGVRQLGLFFPTEWKINFHGSSHHQPVFVGL
jgi:hypothetical protein